MGGGLIWGYIELDDWIQLQSWITDKSGELTVTKGWGLFKYTWVIALFGATIGAIFIPLVNLFFTTDERRDHQNIVSNLKTQLKILD
ncbi:hypothetical protein CI610_02900 [invertebrate metagenome]|uniref:Uncharacterized protein n=1 Tax=invertebrate metagenome TaxID=1711999 RepID=A0A2H9T4N3_9ZZZZ